MRSARELPEPLAEGDLARTPFAHVLLYIQKRALSGTLVVWQPPAGEERPKQDRLRFEEGVPVAGRLLEPASRLERGMLPLFARTSGPYAFYEGVDLVGSGEGVRTGRVDVLPLIAASLRGSSRDDVVAQVCAGFGDAKLRIERGAALDTLGLLPDERALVDVLLAEPMSVARLVEISTLPPRMAERLVYLLALAKMIAPWDGAEARPARPSTPERPIERPRDEHEEEAPSPAPSGEVPPPPPALSRELREAWEEIAQRVKAIEHENYFEMLGVPRDAPASAVQKAYFNQVKKWHPDRVPPELAPLRPYVEEVFRHLTRAQETLCDETKRGRYLATVQDGGGTPAAERRLGMIVQAAMDFRKVEVLMRRREHAEALRLLDRILAINDEEPDYHAARAWLVFQQHPNDPSMRAAALASIERALSLSANHDKAHYYKGMILQREGRTSEALESFRRAAQINPKNIEAVRMVRLAEMRGSDPPASRSDAGSSGAAKRDSLLGKLFGGKKK
ncbi:MAG TPA: DnaJ domain-containing protein [Sandaracinaceae bacterium]